MSTDRLTADPELQQPVSQAADKQTMAGRARRFGALHQAERTLRSMRAYGTVILFSSVSQPIMYILAMGLGLGVLVGEGGDFAEYGASSYLMYIAPAILASTVAMAAGIEFTFPVMEGFKWRRLYYGAQASPLSPGQIASGHILAVSVRFGIHAAIFTVVLYLFGAISSPLGVLMIASAMLGGLAIGLPIMAYVSTLRDEKGQMSLIQRFVIMPLFLFSGTFYPLTNLPGFLQVLGWFSPIWHANELGRVLAFGQPSPAWLILLHVLYLLGITVAAWLATVRIFTRRLGLEEWRGRTPGAKADAKRQERLAVKDAADSTAPGGAAPDSTALPRIAFRRGFGANYYSGNIRAVFGRGLTAIRNNRGVIFLSGLLEPVLFLTSFGLGISPMIAGVDAEQVGLRGGGTISYAAFIAPALLAVSAMNGAIFDSTWNVFFKLKITKLYRTMMSTSLGPVDVAVGEICLALFRGGIYALGFIGVLLVGGLIDPLAAVLMWFTALFVALGFASVGMAVTSFMTRFQQMDWMMMVLMPMFLFSATLFPISVYPAGVQAFIQALPLWHAVELMRDIAFWDFSGLTLVHIGYYLVMIVVGLALTTYRMKKLFLR
ncbi:ABC transporter permease [Nesterenkonia aurantiaca]|uniref:Transport permease protein n=1 Tax=Nesterenkonia aurantiaca TaxID=1436010 RepID=A0A4R7G4Q8_9MICC|nr:ABC transporter permease [Nesterenkonia aurantiaca]TDS86405.1 lipooligosaccharide transport system permease protein [Nesterenkonia aurantiaca]